MFDFLLRPAFLAPAALLISSLVYTIYRAVHPSNLPNLPIVGSKPSDWFPLLQARWRNSTNYQVVAEEINTLYKGRPCLVPIGGSETIVLLPAPETQHIVDQPDAVLNMPQPMIDGLQFKYTVHEQIVIEKPIHQKIVASNLTQQLANLIGDVLDETEYGFEKLWGSETEDFREVVVFDTMRRLIGSVTNRAFVGLPACRNTDLVEAGTSYAGSLVQEAGKLRMYPRFLKPLVAPLYTTKTKKYTAEFANILKPEIQQRLKEYDFYQRNPEKDHESAHNDFLQWSIEQALSHPDPRMALPSTLAGRILMVNFGAIHTTSFTLTHAIFDLFSSQQHHVDELRSEISSALTQHGGWSKKALNAMPKLDSAVRESLRLNMASTFGVPRLVVARSGFTTRSGLRVRRGNIVAVPGKNIARSSDFYPEPEAYRPFRFAEIRSEGGEEVERARRAAPVTGNDFLAFGHGRHACPGRFFAAAEMKLILGFLVLNYEVEMLGKRPEDLYVGASKLPPMSARIRVRRKKAV